MIDKPLVSVVIVTYKHVAFIRECLDGVFMQKTNFDFEVIIGEDGSTDGTREICQEYAAKYPKQVRLFIRSRKDVIYINGHGTGRFNFMSNLKAAKGKYIAMCEGDDYWTDPLKLQKQVDYLESHPEVALCFHKAQLLHEGKFELHSVPESENGMYTYEFLFANYNFITTASVVFRNQIQPLPRWFAKVPYGDMGLYYLITRKGKIACLPEVMSVYRFHAGGMWTGRKKIEAYFAEYNFYNIMYFRLKGELHKLLLKKAKDIIVTIALEKYPHQPNVRDLYERWLRFKLPF